MPGVDERNLPASQEQDIDVPVNLSGLVRLQIAAASAGKTEMEHLTNTVITRLKNQSAYGLEDEVAARHLWDEFCWWRQEGNCFGDMENVVASLIYQELEKAGNDLLILLTAFSVEAADAGLNEEFPVGVINNVHIVKVCLEQIHEVASQRNLDLISPMRTYEIEAYVTDMGVVCSTLSDKGALTDILASHFDSLIDPDESLSDIADEIADAYLEQLVSSSESFEIEELIDKHGEALKHLLIERDIFLTLESTRGAILDELDS